MLEACVHEVAIEQYMPFVGREPRRSAGRHEPYAEAGIEPRLEDLLGDPLTLLLMQRDGVSDTSIRQLIGAAKEGLRARCTA